MSFPCNSSTQNHCYLKVQDFADKITPWFGVPARLVLLHREGDACWWIVLRAVRVLASRSSSCSWQAEGTDALSSVSMWTLDLGKLFLPSCSLLPFFFPHHIPKAYWLSPLPAARDCLSCSVLGFILCWALGRFVASLLLTQVIDQIALSWCRTKGSVITWHPIKLDWADLQLFCFWWCRRLSLCHVLCCNCLRQFTLLLIEML